LTVDASVARTYGGVYAQVGAPSRKTRRRRAIAVFIAATAVSAGLPLYTRNPDHFAGLSTLLEIVVV
jgi:predicted nucleic acid-binding protein